MMGIMGWRFALLWCFVCLHYPLLAQKIEIIADQIDRNATKLQASGDVLLHYRQFSIKTSKVVLFENNATIHIDALSHIYTKEGDRLSATSLLIDTKQNISHFGSLITRSKDDIWVFAKKAKYQNDTAILHDAFLSSCAMKDPLWSIYFRKADYNRTSSHVALKDATLYLKSLPLLYSPYLGFNLKRTRSSGFLFPTFSYNEREGFMYEQPIFWAISLSSDLEFAPQVRTKRGYGGFLTYRLVDSPFSRAQLRLGYFQDTQTYVDTYRLKGAKHYGVEMHYVRSHDIIGKIGLMDEKEGLYFDAIYLNDIEYLNLQNNSLRRFGITPLQESKLNYYRYDTKDFLGIYGKYFIDTRKENNDDTLQILPSLQWHRFLSPLWGSKRLYGASDITLNRFSRKKGVAMRQFEWNVPLEYSATFFDGYLGVHVGEELYFTSVAFDNATFDYNRFNYFSRVDRLGLTSDLYRAYEGFVHFLQPSLTYIKPGNETATPVAFHELDGQQKELFVVGLPEEQLRISVGNYLFDSKSSIVFYDRISQVYFPSRLYRFSQIENEMGFRVGRWYWYNESIYVPEFRSFRRVSSRLSFGSSDLQWSLSHTFKQVLPDRPQDVLANDYLIDINYRFSPSWKFYASTAYSVTQKQSRYWRAGGVFDSDCLGVEGGVRRDIIPRPEGVSFENTFFFRVDFRPFATFGNQRR